MTTPVAGRRSPSCVWTLAFGFILLINNCDQVKQEEPTFGQPNNHNNNNNNDSQTNKWSAQQADAAPDRQQIFATTEPGKFFSEAASDKSFLWPELAYLKLPVVSSKRILFYLKHTISPWQKARAFSARSQAAQ